jgi:hypothetical protein
VTEVGLGDTNTETVLPPSWTMKLATKGERAIGGKDGDGTDTIAVGVRESEGEKEEIIDDDPLEGLLSIVLWLGS